MVTHTDTLPTITKESQEVYKFVRNFNKIKYEKCTAVKQVYVECQVHNISGCKSISVVQSFISMKFAVLDLKKHPIQLHKAGGCVEDDLHLP